MVAFGDLWGFLFIWTFTIIILPASFALTALTFAGKFEFGSIQVN